ncbi:hypothetical protein pb186bvf_015299 [Paramecium bursaria]
MLPQINEILFLTRIQFGILDNDIKYWNNESDDKDSYFIIINMIYKLRNLRMKQQALLIQVSIILIVFTMITVFVLPLSISEIKIIKTSSHQALLKTNDATVTQLSQRIKTLLDQSFLQANLTLDKAQQLYFENINSNYEFKRGLKSPLKNGYILAFQQPQSSEIINSTIHNLQKFSNLLGQLDQFLLSFQLEYQSNVLILFRIQRPHITSTFSQLDLPNNLNVETRPYYTEIIGSPFISTSTYKVSLVLSQTIYDDDGNKDLVMIMGFQFDNLSKYLSLNNIKFVLCTQCNINNSQQVQAFKELTYIYNQTLFPFTKDDWVQMNQYLQNKSYSSNCQESFLKFCRNLDGNDIQLEAQYVQTKFISIIFNDLSFTKQEDQLYKNNINELLISSIKAGLLFFSWSFLVLLISTITIASIKKPVSEMIKIVEFQIRTSNLDQKEHSVKIKQNKRVQQIIPLIQLIQRDVYDQENQIVDPFQNDQLMLQPDEYCNLKVQLTNQTLENIVQNGYPPNFDKIVDIQLDSHVVMVKSIHPNQKSSFFNGYFIQENSDQLNKHLFIVKEEDAIRQPYGISDAKQQIGYRLLLEFFIQKFNQSLDKSNLGYPQLKLPKYQSIRKKNSDQYYYIEEIQNKEGLKNNNQKHKLYTDSLKYLFLYDH